MMPLLINGTDFYNVIKNVNRKYSRQYLKVRLQNRKLFPGTYMKPFNIIYKKFLFAENLKNQVR